MTPLTWVKAWLRKHHVVNPADYSTTRTGINAGIDSRTAQALVLLPPAPFHQPVIIHSDFRAAVPARSAIG
jgi:hypothetical protein